MVVAIIGAATALFAASIGLVQNDIKRVLAYSTISQLGYMIAAAGIGAYVAAGADTLKLQGRSLSPELLTPMVRRYRDMLDGQGDGAGMAGQPEALPASWTVVGR